MDQDTEQLHPSALVSETWYQDLMKTAIDWAWEVDTDGVFVYSNDVSKKVLGLSSDEIIGKSLTEFVIPEEKEEAQKDFARIVSKRKINGKMRNHFKNRDGSISYLDINLRPYYDDNGNLGFHGVGEDVAKVEARDKLWKSKRMQSAIEDVIPGILLADHDNYIRKITRSQLEMFGIENPNSILNTLGAEWVHPDDRQHFSIMRRALISGETSKGINEMRVRMPSGDVRWIRSNVVAVSDDFGEQYTVFCMEDITDRKLAEVELRNSEERYRNLVELSPSGILVHRDGKILFINPSGLEILNAARMEDIIGKSVYDVVSEEYRETIIKRARETMAGAGTKLNEIMGITLIGRSIVIEYTSRRIIYEEKPAVLVIFSDVTDRKAAEEALYKTNRTLRVLSEVNQTLIRSKDETELLQKVCQIIVDVGGYHMAWVGFTEQDEKKSIRPVASAGHVDGYLEEIKLSWADNEYGRGPMGTAIRTRLPASSLNIPTDPFYTPWREEATKYGYISAIAVPLVYEEQAFGAICLYSNKPASFETEEVKLLMELAGDVSYGIMSFRIRDELKMAEDQKRDFYRRTILAATDNKLMMCEKNEIEMMGGPPISTWDVMHVEEPGMIRRVVADVSRSSGLDEDRISDFVLAVGEAVTNALKHAGGGLVSLHNLADSLLVIVSDQGPGIEAINLPEVALRKGYSTAVSLGMGYKAMISIADKIYLSTGPEGTTVGIEMKLTPIQELNELLYSLKDTW